MKNTNVLLCLVGLSLFACHGSPVKKEDLELAKMPVKSIEKVQKVVGIGRIEPENEITSLAVNASGIVQKIYVQEGENVQAGKVLFALENSVELAKIAEVESKIISQNAQIQWFENQIKQTQIQYNNRKSYFQRMKTLFESNATTKQEFENAETEYLTQESKLESNLTELRLAKSRLAEIEKQLQTAQAEAQKKVVKATQTGKILELLVQEGNAIEALATFAKFAPEGKTIATCEIDELFAQQIALNQTAEIRLLGNENILTVGKVIFVSDYLRKKSLFSEKAGDQEDRRVREIKILLDKPNVSLFNTRVECAIKIQ
jgi:multidrug resistance efflux pump